VSWLSRHGLCWDAFVEVNRIGSSIALRQPGDYTTDINDALLSWSKSVASMFALLSGNAASP